MRTFLLCGVFFLSGLAALVFENLWFYQSGLALGNSVWASSLVLAGFMGGLALGNALAGRFGHRVRRPLRLYAGLEVAIGVFGFTIVLVLPALTPLLARFFGPFLEIPWVVNPLRLGTAFVLLLVPAVAMGATLPTIVSALYRHDPDFGRILGRLYGWNTLGAVAGVLFAELWLVEALGVHGTAIVAFSVNAAAALVSLLLSRALEVSDVARPRPEPAPLPRAVRGYLAAAALFGFVLLGLEVVWFRFLTLFVWGTGTAFAILLAVVLAGIGLGGLAGGWLSRRVGPGAMPGLALLSGALCVALYALYPSGPRATDALEIAGLASRVIAPIAFLSGVLFTLLGRAIERAAPGESRAAGLLTLANTGGAMLGSLVAGFVLLPRLGMEGSWIVLAAAYGVAAWLLVVSGARATSRLGRHGVRATAVAFVLALLLLPGGRMERQHLPAAVEFYAEQPRTRVVGVQEGLTETIVYLETRAFGEPHFHRMLTNGFSMSGTNTNAQRYMKLFVYLPLALHPELRSALLISFGVGMTAEALVSSDSFERIDVVDISRDVLEMNALVFPDPASAPLADPRVRAHVEDGRYFLQTTHQRFDLITGEPPPPKLAGVGTLYSREYFQLAHDRLNEGGIVSYWLPVHSLIGDDAPSIARAFCDVFADCTLWGGAGLDWVLLGSRGGIAPVSAARLARPWRDPKLASRLAAIGVESPLQLGTLFMADAAQLNEWIGAAPPVTDDYPKRLTEAFPDRSVSVPGYLEWMDVAAAARRFEESEWVASVWPASLRDETLALFPFERVFQRAAMGARRPIGAVLPELDTVLRATDLETLPLWLLRSDATRQAAARRREATVGASAACHAELGIGALARREWRRAAARFAAARAAGLSAPGWHHLELYARLRAGDPLARPALAALQGSRDRRDREAASFLDARLSALEAGAPSGH